MIISLTSFWVTQENYWSPLPVANEDLLRDHHFLANKKLVLLLCQTGDESTEENFLPIQ